MGGEEKKTVAIKEEEKTGDEEFMAELDKVLEERNKEASESEPPEDDPAAADKSTDETAEGKPEETQDDSADNGDKGGEEPPAIGDALVERAVKAGVTLADARAFGSAEALERVVERIEEAAKTAAKSETDGSASEEQEAEDEDPLAVIPDLDPEEYDEKLVDAFKAVKGIAGKLFDANKELRDQLAQVKSKESGSWLDKEIAGLGKDFEKVFGTVEKPDAKARQKLERYIKFVQEDAKAEGKDLSQGDAFKTALKQAFGDQVKEMEGAAVAEAARQRSRKAVSRPRDTSGRFASDKADGPESEEDREAEAIAAVAEFFEDD